MQAAAAVAFERLDDYLWEEKLMSANSANFSSCLVFSSDEFIPFSNSRSRNIPNPT